MGCFSIFFLFPFDNTVFCFCIRSMHFLHEHMCCF